MAGEARRGPLPFDWPEQAAAKTDWGLARLAPAHGVLTTKLSVDGGKVREDRWRFELTGPQDGRIQHEMTWRGPRLKLRREREEAVMEGGKVRTRTLGRQFADWPDDSRWRTLMARPATDWQGLVERMGEGVTTQEITRDPSGAVTAARLAGGGSGWTAELIWETSRR